MVLHFVIPQFNVLQEQEISNVGCGEYGSFDNYKCSNQIDVMVGQFIAKDLYKKYDASLGKKIL